MSTSIALVGYGKWGKILNKRLKKFCHVKYILRSKDNIKKIYGKVKWAVVATPDKTHYKILKKLINAKINIFCEKPLTTSFKTSKKLIQLAKKNKVKMYISDIEKFKNKKIELKKKNFIYRSRKQKIKNYDFLRRLFYHDIYLLYPKLKFEKIKNIKFLKNLYNIEILIAERKRTFTFNYVLGKSKSHKINDVNFFSNKDYIETMIKKVFSSKVNYKANQLCAINTIKILEKTKNARN